MKALYITLTIMTKNEKTAARFAAVCLCEGLWFFKMVMRRLFHKPHYAFLNGRGN